MFPFYTCTRNVVSAFFASIILTSCADRSKTDLKVINALNESIENSNKTVNATTVDIMHSLEAKLHDYSTKERAQVWFPIAQTIQKISKKAYEEIQEIKFKLEKGSIKTVREEDISNVFNSLLKYKNEILQVDSRLTRYFQQYLRIFTRSIDSTNVNQESLFRDFFSNAYTSAIIAMLSKLQNNIKLNEERMVTFCHEYSTPICGMGAIMTSVLVMQSASIVQKGGEIEITAGLASVSVEQKPKVIVYNTFVPLNDAGLAVYKLKAASKPGKYYVPVKIKYTDQNGREQSMIKEIEYTVAEIVKKKNSKDQDSEL